MQSLHTQARASERGNVFTILLASVALSAALSVILYQNLSGPLATMVRVNNKVSAQTQMQAASNIIIASAIHAASSSDCDSDTIVEPPVWVTAVTAPANGGTIPTNIGAPITDPWGTDYGYCVWDIGSFHDHMVDNGCGNNGGLGINRLDGTPDPAAGDAVTQTVIALVSAGPDRTFQTTCNDYVDATTDVMTTTGGSDDIIKRLTYNEASESLGLWSLANGDPDTAEIDRNITSTGVVQASAVNVSANMVATGSVTAGRGVILGEAATIDASFCNDPGDQEGRLRYVDADGSVEVCDDGAWVALGGGGGGGGTFDAGTVSAPGFPVTGDSNTGLWQSAADIVNIAAGGVEAFRFNTAASGVNYLAATPAATGNGPTLSSAGTDANVDLNIAPKGIGVVSVSSNVVATGSVAVGSDATACSTSNQGAIRFDSTDQVLKFCNGGFWRTVTSTLDPADYVSPGVTVTSITQCQNAACGNIDLTSLGADDWAVWYDDGDADTPQQRRSGGGSQISGALYGGAVGADSNQYCDVPNQPTISWTDGAPTASGNNSDCILLLFNVQAGEGYAITVPADQTERTLRLVVGVGYASARFTATFSNNLTGTPDYTGTTFNHGADGGHTKIFDFTYSNPEANQTLTVYWLPTTSGAYMGLFAAALTEN